MRHYNRTNFTSNEFALKLLRAMRDCLKDGFHHYIENRRGQRWLRVAVVDGLNSRPTFQFILSNGQDAGHLILQALFVWNPQHEKAFAKLTCVVYGMSQHPYITARLLRAAEERKVIQAEKLSILKKLGATHSFRNLAGKTYLGRWGRTWLGKRFFEVLTDHNGTAYGIPFKLTGEDIHLGSIQGAFA